jgi:hypothetical protein
MERIYVDCNELPSEGHCSAIIAAGSETELLEAAAKHAHDAHGHKDGPELRDALRHIWHHGLPPHDDVH